MSWNAPTGTTMAVRKMAADPTDLPAAFLNMTMTTTTQFM